MQYQYSVLVQYITTVADSLRYNASLNLSSIIRLISCTSDEVSEFGSNLLTLLLLGTSEADCGAVASGSVTGCTLE